MTNINRLCLTSYFLLPVVTALTAIAWLTAIPADQQSVVLFGMTKSRLLVAGILFFAAVSLASLAIYAWRNTEQTIRWLKEKLASPRFLLIAVISSGVVFLIASLFLSIPEKYLGVFWAIEERLRPLAIWALLTSLQVLIGLIGWRASQQLKTTSYSRDKLIPTGVALSLLLATWALIAITGLGFNGGNSYWSKAGVPVLWPQVFLALVTALAFQLFLTRFTKIASKSIWLEVCLCVLIWLSAAILWHNQSYVPGVFNTPARPPNNEIYPINDALIFDAAAQKTLIGQRLASEAKDKPVFIAYLAILHALGGISYTNFYLLQSLSLAFIPVLGYWIGKSLHSRSLGLVFAMLLVFKEQNAIALTNYIHVSTSKLILSEMLTALGALLFTLFLIKWLKRPQWADSPLWRAGGVLGLTSLVRLNAVGIFPIAILLIGLALRLKWKPWLAASLLLSAFILISAIPWLARNFIVSDDPFDFIRSKTSTVVVKQRYEPLIEKNTPEPTQAPASKPLIPEANNYLILGQSIATNYLHNLIGITVMLPPSLELYKLLDLVRLPYWNMDWTGALLPGALWIILGVLTLTAWGLATAWQRWRAAGLVPLAVILGYNLTTAVSLTSGGRYLVPIDWGVLLYFAIGLLEVATGVLALFGWPKANETPNPPILKQSKGNVFSRILVLGALFVFLGAIPILIENLPPKRYPASVGLDDFLRANQALPELSTPQMMENLATLWKTPPGRVYYGQAIYPRYFGENKGDGATLAEDPLIGSADFDHLSFYLIGGKYDTAVVLPTSARVSPYIAGADTWVIGCQRDNHLEAMLVIFRTKDVIKVYQQEPTKTGCQ